MTCTLFSADVGKTTDHVLTLYLASFAKYEPVFINFNDIEA